MDAPPDRPWAEHEKVSLLAEILKAAPVNANDLFRILQDLRVQPRWEEIALPLGRSLKSSQFAYSELQAIYSGHPVYPRYTPYAPPVEPLGARRLPPPIEGPITSSGGRILQPRPPGSLTTFTPNLDEPARKKRGRPTNAEMARKAEEAAARGEVYPPPKRQRSGKPDNPSPRPSLTGEVPQASAGSPSTPALAPPAERMLLTPTAPPVPGPDPVSEPSSRAQKQSLPQQELPTRIEGEGEMTVDEPLETPSRITTTVVEGQSITTRPAPTEDSGALSRPPDASREEVQAKPNTMTTVPILPDPKND